MPAGDQFISIVLKQFWIVNNIQKQTGCDIQNLYSKIWKKPGNVEFSFSINSKYTI